MTETLVNGYLSESTQYELSNEYQHDRVWMDFNNLCVLVLFNERGLSIGRVNPYFPVATNHSSIILLLFIFIFFGKIVDSNTQGSTLRLAL